MLKINNVSKVFFKGTVSEKTAIDKLNLELKKGDFVTVIGGNGAGKSTILNMVAGSIFPDAGSILLDGKNITYEKEYKRAKHIGRLFQDPLKGTAPSMTIEENLSLAYGRGTFRGLGQGIKKSDVEYFITKLKMLDLGLENRLKTKVGLLSGGQRQALTLVMATLITPKILLLDEHTAALDPVTSKKIMKITDEIIREKGLTALMVTHNMKEALEFGNRTIMMDSGRIIADISGKERAETTVEGLIQLFSKNSEEGLNDDKILLSR